MSQQGNEEKKPPLSSTTQARLKRMEFVANEAKKLPDKGMLLGDFIDLISRKIGMSYNTVNEYMQTLEAAGKIHLASVYDPFGFGNQAAARAVLPKKLPENMRLVGDAGGYEIEEVKHQSMT